MPNKSYTSGTVIDSGSLNDFNTATYNILSSVAGTNTITATGPLSFSAYGAGKDFEFVPAVTNTGAVTINISGLGARAITKFGTTPLVAGDLVAGAVVRIIDDGTRFQLLNPQTIAVTGVVPIANGGTNATTAAQALINLGATGRLIGTQVFTASGTYTPTAGTTRILVRGQGAGGGGGGSVAPAASQVSVGSGGGAGGVGETFLTSGFSGATVTVGNGGSGGIGTTGGTGGSSSFGAFLTLSGGVGGNTAASAAAAVVGGGAGGTASGGNILNHPGQSGALATAWFNASATMLSGAGGTSLYGSGGTGQAIGMSVATAASGVSALGRGAGGGGACSANGAGAGTGGAGTGGIFIVYEYA